MKTVKVILNLVLLFAITGGCSKDENEYPFSYEEFILPQLQGMNMPRPADSWNYPVCPGGLSLRQVRKWLMHVRFRKKD
jgi:hypothetical protein